MYAAGTALESVRKLFFQWQELAPVDCETYQQ